jgi:hypothetical protein
VKVLQAIILPILVLPSFAVVACGQDNGCYGRTTTISETFAQELIERAFKLDDTIEAEQQRVRKAIPLRHFFCAVPVQLSRNGKPGLLIHMADVDDAFGGMLAKPIWVYERTAQGYKMLLEDMGGYLAPIAPLKTFTNAYRDIRTQNHSGGNEHEITIFKFVDGHYQPRVCITETYIGKRRGRERFKYTRHKCET